MQHQLRSDRGFASCLTAYMTSLYDDVHSIVITESTRHYSCIFFRDCAGPPLLLYSVHRTQRRGLDLVTTSIMLCAICTGSLYSIASLTSSAYLCLLFTIIGRHRTWSTVSPPQPVSAVMGTSCKKSS